MWSSQSTLSRYADMGICLSVRARPPIWETLQNALIGPPVHAPLCPLRYTIVGAYGTQDRRKLQILIALSLAGSTAAIAGVIQLHKIMFLIDFIISICT